jgi:glycine C-acetyltransferase
MSTRAFLDFLEAESRKLRQAGLWRAEPELTTPQGPVVKVGDKELLSFASSDYLGLASHPEVRKAAIAAIETWGLGLAAPRMATGTCPLHTELERRVAKLLETGDALVYPSSHHADTGLFESLLDDRDYVFCDEMIRPSLADGIRLSRARVYAYRNGDMDHLEDRLKRSRAARFRIIATDAVFPMIGSLADLKSIYALAEKYHAMVVVDDSEGVGVLGRGGEGTHGALGVGDKIDLVVGSFGHALGGTGGFVAGRTSIVSWLRQKSRPYIASNALAPSAAAAALTSIEIVQTNTERRRQMLAINVRTFKDTLARDAGFSLEIPHPAISIRIRSALATQRLVDFLHRSGIYVLGYCHPVVPEGDARISIRITARHSTEDVQRLTKTIGEGMNALKVSF